ncbi:MAG: nucleotidyltransferase domain-containing protein [Gammaproteobacteria bacterium]|nr:MAG: nucleotidyltransferase domain-containing protein [Gammaproteobacteria bacterium]
MTRQIRHTHNQHSTVHPKPDRGSDQNFIDQLTTLLLQFPQIKLALLFGSQASGNVHPDSDIDLGILAQAPLSADFKLQLMQTVGAKFGRPVDIVDLYHVPEPITGQALSGIRLLGDDTVCGNLLYRHLLNVADFFPLQQRILTERRNRWIK